MRAQLNHKTAEFHLNTIYIMSNIYSKLVVSALRNDNAFIYSATCRCFACVDKFELGTQSSPHDTLMPYSEKNITNKKSCYPTKKRQKTKDWPNGSDSRFCFFFFRCFLTEWNSHWHRMNNNSREKCGDPNEGSPSEEKLTAHMFPLVCVVYIFRHMKNNPTRQLDSDNLNSLF